MATMDEVLARPDLASLVRKHHRYVHGNLKPLLARLPQGAEVADIACGDGLVSGMLAAEGFKVASLDHDDVRIEKARRLFPEGQFLLGDAQFALAEVLGRERYPLVVSLEVIEHLYAPKKYLNQLFEICKPDGTLLLSTPYHGYWKNLALSLVNGWDRHFHPWQEGGHIKFFSPRSLIALVEEAGFSIESVKGAGRLPLLWETMFLSARKPG